MYRPSTSFTDRSNARGRQLQRIKDAQTEEAYNQCEGATKWGRCTKNVGETQREYSTKFFEGRTLCWSCQDKERKSGR